MTPLEQARADLETSMCVVQCCGTFIDTAGWSDTRRETRREQ